MTSESPVRSNRTSRSASAVSRRRRSKWLAPLRSFANGGYRVDGSIFGNAPRAVECVAKPGKACKENAPVLTQALSSNATLNQQRAAIIDSLLQGVVQHGTGVAAAIPGRQVAGKTGTTENFGDAWFVGFTPQIVTAVWVGYPNKLVPDAARVPRPRRRRRHVPGADLEGVHDAGSCPPQPSTGDVSSRAVAVRLAASSDVPQQADRA